LEHFWLDFPSLNTAANQDNLMNTRENSDTKLRKRTGTRILPVQIQLINQELKKHKRDGKDC